MIKKWLTPAVILRFKPYRKVFIAIAVVSTFFSFLIIFENIFFIIASDDQRAVLLLIPYLLSWLLVTLACIFGRIAFLLHSPKNKTAVICPQSPTAWLSDSRPISPISVDPLSVSYHSQSQLFRSSLAVPQSPFCIVDHGTRYPDLPPSYDDVMRNSTTSFASVTAAPPL
ncbi:hypothetical protein V3C99_001389 [Haemonchus contortus]